MVQRLKVNQFYGAPTAIRLLLKYGDQWVQKYDRSTLKTLGTGRGGGGSPVFIFPTGFASIMRPFVCVQWGSPSTLKPGSGITEWLEMAAAQWWTPGGKRVTDTRICCFLRGNCAPCKRGPSQVSGRLQPSAGLLFKRPLVGLRGSATSAVPTGGGRLTQQLRCVCVCVRQMFALSGPLGETRERPEKPRFGEFH